MQITPNVPMDRFSLSRPQEEKLSDREAIVAAGLYCLTASFFFENTPVLPSSKGVCRLRDRLDTYRKKADKDVLFRQAAIDFGFPPENLERASNVSFFTLENLGIFCSDDRQDTKFAIKVARDFLRDYNPKRGFLFGSIEGVTALLNNTPAAIEQPEKKPFLIGPDVVAKTNYLLVLSISMLVLGNAAETLVKRLSGATDTDSIIQAAVNYGTPTLCVIYSLAPEYWQYVLEVYFVRVGVDRKVAKALAQDGALVHFYERFKTEFQLVADMREAKEKRRTVKAESEQLRQEAADLRNQLASRPDNSVIDNLRDENQRLAEKLAAVQHRNELLEASTKEAVQKTEELSAGLAKAEKQVSFLNNELLEVGEGQNEPVEESTQAGIRQRLGDEAMKHLGATRVMIIGGMPATCSVLRELFPNWVFADGDKKVPHDPASSIDAMLLMSSYCSHLSFYTAKSQSRVTGIPLFYCPRNSPIGACEVLLNMLPT